MVKQRDRLAKYGPWALVTGASDGIGKAFAQNLADTGFNLVLVARRRSRLEQLAVKMADARGIETRVLSADLSRPDELQRVIDATREMDIGLLVACAGFGCSGKLVDSALPAELEMLDVNCRTVLALTHEFSRRFVARRRGGLVLMSSIVAFQGVPRAANYAATKAYVQTLAEGLRAELAPHGVDIIACAPGPIHSGFARRANMHLGMALQPQVVAAATLGALGKRTTVRPGWLSKLLETLLKLPRWGRTLIMQQVMNGMTKHQNKANVSAR